jgi:hypothetical protein
MDPNQFFPKSSFKRLNGIAADTLRITCGSGATHAHDAKAKAERAWTRVREAEAEAERARARVREAEAEAKRARAHAHEAEAKRAHAHEAEAMQMISRIYEMFGSFLNSVTRHVTSDGRNLFVITCQFRPYQPLWVHEFVGTVDVDRRDKFALTGTNIPLEISNIPLIGKVPRNLVEVVSSVVSSVDIHSQVHLDLSTGEYVRLPKPAHGFVVTTPPARGFVVTTPPARGFVVTTPPARGVVVASTPLDLSDPGNPRNDLRPRVSHMSGRLPPARVPHWH